VLKPGWVGRIIRGEVVEPIEMKFCIPCSLWYVEGDHNHVEPVEPDLRVHGLLCNSNDV